jgi:hypothetical protein
MDTCHLEKFKLTIQAYLVLAFGELHGRKNLVTGS